MSASRISELSACPSSEWWRSMAAASRCGGAVRDPEHRDDQRDVGLDRLDDVADRGALLAHEPKDTVARLGERRERLECLEGGRQATSMTLGRVTRGGGCGLGPVRDRLECSFHSRLSGLPWLGGGSAVPGLRATGQIIGSSALGVEYRVAVRNWRWGR